MTLLVKDARDAGNRGSIGVWRYMVDHSDFTSTSGQTEVITISPLVATGQTISGGGAIILDAWMQVSELFAEPRGGTIELACGIRPSSTDLLDGSPVHTAGSGTLNLKGLTTAEKGTQLVNRAAGQTIWVAENTQIDVEIEVASPALPNETTQGIATIVIQYMTVPRSNQ